MHEKSMETKLTIEVQWMALADIDIEPTLYCQQCKDMPLYIDPLHYPRVT